MIQFKQYDFTPILGWSHSRYDTFSSCKRQYYYQYYGKHDPDFSWDQIARLKSLTSIPMETGNVVHETISAIMSRMLKSNADIDREKFNAFVARKINLTCNSSKFFEVHYAEQEEVRLDDLAGAVEECLESFLSSERYEWVRSNAYRNEHYLIDPPGYGETRLQGMKIYAKLDFLFIVDDQVVILDWKTGQIDKEKHEKQLLGYSAWAFNNLNPLLLSTEGVVAYLKPSYQEITVHPSESDLQKLASQIKSESEEMYEFCSDVEENIPIGKEYFAMTSRSGFCEVCNYKELCGRM